MGGVQAYLMVLGVLPKELSGLHEIFSVCQAGGVGRVLREHGGDEVLRGGIPRDTYHDGHWLEQLQAQTRQHEKSKEGAVRDDVAREVMTLW